MEAHPLLYARLPKQRNRRQVDFTHAKSARCSKISEKICGWGCHSRQLRKSQPALAQASLWRTSDLRPSPKLRSTQIHRFQTLCYLQRKQLFSFEMERPPTGIGRSRGSRVHFGGSEPGDDEAEPTVNVASFDPEPDESEQGTDEGKSVTESVSESDDVTKDITEAKSPSSFYFAEESDDESDHGQMPSRQDAEQLHRFLRFKSPSAPTSPQSSPVSSPQSSPPSFPQNRDSDIPLLQLNGNRAQFTADSRRNSAGTVIEKEQRENKNSLDSTDQVGKREADRLIRAHTRRSKSKDFLHKLSSTPPTFRSGSSTPEDDEHSRHYTFNSGVLTNLLKLYFDHLLREHTLRLDTTNNLLPLAILHHRLQGGAHRSGTPNPPITRLPR